MLMQLFTTCYPGVYYVPQLSLVHLSPRIDPLEHPHPLIPLEPSSIGCGEMMNPRKLRSVWKFGRCGNQTIENQKHYFIVTENHLEIHYLVVGRHQWLLNSDSRFIILTNRLKDDFEQNSLCHFTVQAIDIDEIFLCEIQKDGSDNWGLETVKGLIFIGGSTLESYISSIDYLTKLLQVEQKKRSSV